MKIGYIVDADIIDALEQALEYFEDRQDVEDGDYGQPRPNQEMRLALVCRRALATLEKVPT